MAMDDIYTAIIDELIPIAAKQNETTSDFVTRYDTIMKLKFEIDKKQRQVDNERQSKKRFELNDELKKLKEQLAILEN